MIRTHMGQQLQPGGMKNAGLGSPEPGGGAGSVTQTVRVG